MTFTNRFGTQYMANFIDHIFVQYLLYLKYVTAMVYLFLHVVATYLDSVCLTLDSDIPHICGRFDNTGIPYFGIGFIF